MTTPRVLFVSYPLAGHLNPLIAVMQGVRAAGCRVTCVMPSANTLADVRRDVLTGVDLCFCPTAADAPRAARLKDEAGAIAWAREVIASAPDRVPALRTALRACAPDFVVLDPFPMTASSLAAVHLEGIPYALLWPNLLAVAPQRLRAGFRRAADDAMRDMLVPLGVEWSHEFGSPRSPVLNVAPVIAEFIGGEVAGVELVGFPRAPERRGDEVDFDWSIVPDSPFVYISFGTILESGELLHLLFKAARRLGLRVLASVGSLMDELGDCGDDVVTARYVPQREVLRRASVFITHGGYNSVAEALDAGTPMLVVPLSLDQPLQAHYVAESGAGRALHPAQLTEESATEAIAALTADGNDYRVQAGRLSKLTARCDPTATTVGHIMAALSAARR